MVPEQKIFEVFVFHYKFIGANGPRDVANSDPWGGGGGGGEGGEGLDWKDLCRAVLKIATY